MDWGSCLATRESLSGGPGPLLFFVMEIASMCPQSPPACSDASKTASPLDLMRSKALLKTGALQSAILGSANFSIIATDDSGIIQLFNVGAERLLGYRAVDVVNKLTPGDLHDPEELMLRARSLSQELGVPIAPGFQALTFKASRDIEDVYELSHVRKDGSRFPGLVSITGLRDFYGEIIGYLFITCDHSQRKHAETELERAMHAAETANQAKSDFLSSMSHELRTPLSAILGFAQLLESGTPAPTSNQQRSLKQILKAGWYLLDLINEILDLALIESGKLQLSLEPMSLTEVLQECRAMIEPQAQARNLRMLFPCGDDPGYVHADRTRVKQVLINLLSNAIKYNRKDGCVVVDLLREDPAIASGCIRICISDSGEGLSAENMAQLFQPFNRLGREAGVQEGTGIGLVVCKRLVELMAGRIGVESTLGTGSTFWIELALAESPQAGAELPARALAEDAAMRPETPLRTVLYVEDNPANLMLIEDLLARRPDIRFLSAMDGTTGVALARSCSPDVILMDVNLPGISGIQAMLILKNDPNTAHIPVVALSANAIPRDINKGLQAGFFRYLTKPIKVVEFMATLDEALQLAATQTIPPQEDVRNA